MSAMIIYGSKYGTAKRYAQELARRLGTNAVSCQDVTGSSGCGTVVHFGGLYAGGVTGLSKTVKSISADSEQTLIIATVGLADPNDPANAKHLKESIRRQIPKELYYHVHMVHLRGGIDYRKLSFLHRTMMKLFYNHLKKQPQETRSAETQAIIDTYGQTVDFVNFDTLAPILDLLYLL